MNNDLNQNIKATTQRKINIVHPSQYARMINEAAYYRAEQRGFLPGYELLDWLEAEEEILGSGYQSMSNQYPHMWPEKEGQS